MLYRLNYIHYPDWIMNGYTVHVVPAQLYTHPDWIMNGYTVHVVPAQIMPFKSEIDSM